MHGGEKTCPDSQRCLDWKENGSARVDVSPVEIMITLWLISSIVGHRPGPLFPSIFERRNGGFGSNTESLYLRVITMRKSAR